MRGQRRIYFQKGIKMELKIKLLRETSKPPFYASAGAAAADMYADIGEAQTLAPGKRTIIPTGVCAEIPEGYVGILAARSGLSIKKGIALSNGIGVIDSDYRGEIGAAITNFSDEEYTIEPGERICQLMIMPVTQVSFTRAADLEETERGAGGFGSTGRGV